MSKLHHLPKVKICGVADASSLQSIVKLGIHAVGFIFYEASPRSVVGAQVKGWLETIPPFLDTVGVFVDEKPQQVKKIFDLCGLSRLQFHGQETPEYCSEFPKHRVIKAFRVKNDFRPESVRPYLEWVSAVLLDSSAAGSTFDWDIARHVKDVIADMPLILAGGITPENVEDAIQAAQPYAIDVSSSVEISPGVKDPLKVQDLLRRISSNAISVD